MAVNPPGLFGWSHTKSWQRMLETIHQLDLNNRASYEARWDATDRLNGIDY